MLALALTPAVLSLLVLAAHFLRRGQLVPCVVVLGGLVVMLVLRRPWVPRLVQVVLLLAVALWGSTLFAMVKQRQAAGEPAGRLAVILGSVIVVNVIGALLLGSTRVRGAYAGRT